jgi:hypothetical protein
MSGIFKPKLLLDMSGTLVLGMLGILMSGIFKPKLLLGMLGIA